MGAMPLQNLLQIKGDGAGPTALPTRPAKNITIRGIPDLGLIILYYILYNTLSCTTGDRCRKRSRFPVVVCIFLLIRLVLETIF